METDRLLTPSKEVQVAVDSLWKMIRRAGDILAAKQQHDIDTQARISQLEAELEAKTDLIASQNATIESWKEEISTLDDLRATLKSLYENVNDLQSAIADRDQQIAKLHVEAEQRMHSATELDVLQQRLRTTEAEMTAWQTRAENMEQSLQQRGLQVAEAENEVRVTRAELQAVRAEHELRQNTTHKELQELLQSTTDLRRQLVQAEGALQLSQDEMQRLQRDAEDLRIKLQRQDDATTEYKSQLMEMTARMYEREKQAVLAEERVKQLEENQAGAVEADQRIDQELRSELEEYKQRVSQFEQELEAVRSEMHTVTQQRDELTRAAEDLPESPFRQLAQSIRQTAEYLSQGEAAGSAAGLRLREAQRESVHGIVDKLRSAVQILESAMAA